jgi:hypothetical protein
MMGMAAAILVLWIAVWILLGVLNGSLSGHAQSLKTSCLRGVLAAIGSGIAFYAISDIWLKRSPGGPNYLVHFLSWTVAFLPGLLALLVSRK